MKALNRFYTLPLTDRNNYAYVRTLVEAVVANNSCRRVLLVTKKMKDATIVETLIGKKLSSTKENKFPGTNLNIVHKSIDNFDSIEHEAFVALGLSSDDILKIEENIKSRFLIASPWIPGQLDKWAKFTQATLIPNQTQIPAYPKIDCIVEQALKAIESIGEGVSHDGDYDRIKTVFTVLSQNGVVTNRDEIEGFLFTDFKWSKEKIEKVLAVHDAIKSGKRVSGKLLSTAKTFFKKWQETCEANK